MGGYVRRIATIKQLKNGFSASGAALSGLVKAEKYGSGLAVECSLINFAPLSEGKYTCAITDGKIMEIFDCPSGESKSDIDLSEGFAAVICFVKGGVQAIASAISGEKGYELLALKAAVERVEKNDRPAPPEDNDVDLEYHDEAIAEVNYYELERAENGGADGAAEKEKASGKTSQKDENDTGAFGKEQKPGQIINDGKIKNLNGGTENISADISGGTSDKAETNGATLEKSRRQKPEFYKKIEGEARRLLREHPKDMALCEAVENSEWVKINYGSGKHYVFGVIYENGEVKTLCYGVPANSSQPSESLKDIAVFVPAGGGYFISCQSARTGKTIKIKL